MSAENGNTQQAARRVQGEPAWRSPWVWGMAIMVLVMLVANITMIMVGASTSPGLVVEDFYDRGKNYFNAEGQRKDEETRLRWRMDLHTPPSAAAGKPANFQLTALDADGYPVTNAVVDVAAFRPTDASRDFSQPLREIERGVYAADISFALPGNWDLIVTVKRGNDKLDLARRIFINN